MSNYMPIKFESVVSVKSILAIKCMDLRRMRVKGESHNFSQVYYVEQGTSEVFVDGRHYTLGEGDMIIYGPNTFQGKCPYYIPGGIVKIISFEIDSMIMESLYNHPFKLNLSQRTRLEVIISKGQLQFVPLTDLDSVKDTLLTEDFDPRKMQELKNLFELFLIDVSYHAEGKISEYGVRKEQFYQHQMERLTDYLIKHIDRNPSLQDMQSALWISASSLRRLVHTCKGCGPVAYYNELRINEAKKLIRKTDLNMTEIADKLGFSSLAYFSRFFRRKTGISPTEYANAVGNL